MESVCKYLDVPSIGITPEKEQQKQGTKAVSVRKLLNDNDDIKLK